MAPEPAPDPVYLDYAATSAIRPQEIVDAVSSYLTDVGATPGRGAYRRAVEAGRIVFRCRRAIAELLAIPGDPGRITFQLNATHALNTALAGVLRDGDSVVRTAYDHNAVRRPIVALRGRGVRERVLSGTRDGGLDFDEVERALAGGDDEHRRGGRARLLVVPHVSNVLGSLLPVADLVEVAHAHGALVLLDAAQSVGHLPVDVARLGVDLLAFTGHKGLLGPQGTGGLWVRQGVDVQPLLFGGAGGDSAADSMPAALPDRLEAGTQNGPGIAGLLAGVEWIARRGVVDLHRRQMELKLRLRARMAAIPGVTILSPAAPDGAGIVTFRVEGRASSEVAHRLDARFGIMTRAGLHCAPETHALLGTSAEGAVRASLGWASDAADVDALEHALRVLSGNVH